MEINKKLKSIYFYWSINYDGPPPRTFAVTFEDHLEMEYYELCCDNWLEKILTECNIPSEEEFKQQVTLIEAAWEKYTNEQYNKRKRRSEKKARIHSLKHPEELPF